MKILLRNLLAFLLVFVMIFTLGVTSFTEDVDNYGEPLDVLSNSYSSDDSVQGDVYGGFDEDDIGTIPIPQEPDEVEKDVYEPPKEFTEDDGEDDGDNDRDNDGDDDIIIPQEPGSVVDDVYGDNSPPEEEKIFDYTIRYYFVTLDGEEIEGEIKGQVSSKDHVINAKDIPVPEGLPEAYVIDEEKSTLPYTVTEDGENIIEVYYVFDLEMAMQLGFMPMAVGGLQTNFIATTDVFDLKDLSTNDNTRIFYAWYNGPDLYLAVGLKFGNFITNIYLNGDSENPVPIVDLYKGEEGEPTITVNGNDYHMIYDDVFKKNPTKIWNVVNIGPQSISAKFDIKIETNLGGGHWLEATVEIINSNLQVYHDYEGMVVFDTDQSGILIFDTELQKFIYSVEPKYNGEEYELTEIKVIHNDDDAIYNTPDDLDVDGKLKGSVSAKTVGGKLTGSAEITFIYRKVVKGSIKITKLIQNLKDEDSGRVFDIFVRDANNNIWTVTLTNNESKTILDLPIGEYTIKEIVPMNFELVSIIANSTSDITNNPKVYLTKDNPDVTIVITNERTNNGWFHHEDEEKNTFPVITITAMKEVILPEVVAFKEELDEEVYV